MLNMDVLNRTIAAIKVTDGKHFNMSHYFLEIASHEDITRVGGDDVLPHCKTAGCIAGWVVMATPIEERTKYFEWSGYGAGMHLLGINDEVAGALFTPAHYAYNQIKREHAIKVLEHLRDHKLLDWRITGLKPIKSEGDPDAVYPIPVE